MTDPYTGATALKKGQAMKIRIATLVLLSATTSSAFAYGGDALAGFAVGTIVGNVIASQPRAAVTVHYGGGAPHVVYAPPPVVAPFMEYAPPPPMIGYAPPPPAMVYPAPRVFYNTPSFGPGYGFGRGNGHGHRQHHHYQHRRDFDGHGRGHGRW
jgi:hypothetical protein